MRILRKESHKEEGMVVVEEGMGLCKEEGMVLEGMALERMVVELVLEDKEEGMALHKVQDMVVGREEGK